jgi:hypothetical protein
MATFKDNFIPKSSYAKDAFEKSASMKSNKKELF